MTIRIHLFRELIGHLGKGEALCIAYPKERSAMVVTDGVSSEVLEAEIENFLALREKFRW